jgi:hypothetical protein
MGGLELVKVVGWWPLAGYEGGWRSFEDSESEIAVVDTIETTRSPTWLTF